MKQKQKDTIREEFIENIVNEINYHYNCEQVGNTPLYEIIDRALQEAYQSGIERGAQDKVEEVRKYFEKRKEDIQAIMEFIDTSLKDNT